MSKSFLISALVFDEAGDRVVEQILRAPPIEGDVAYICTMLGSFVGTIRRNASS
jgi:hypothetical protein